MNSIEKVYKNQKQMYLTHKTFQVGNTHPSLHSPNHLEPKLSHRFLFKPLPVWLEGRQKQCERVRATGHLYPAEKPIFKLQRVTHLQPPCQGRSHNHCHAASYHLLWKSHIRDPYPRNVASVESVIQSNLPLY